MFYFFGNDFLLFVLFLLLELQINNGAYLFIFNLHQRGANIMKC